MTNPRFPSDPTFTPAGRETMTAFYTVAFLSAIFVAANAPYLF